MRERATGGAIQDCRISSGVRILTSFSVTFDFGTDCALGRQFTERITTTLGERQERHDGGAQVVPGATGTRCPGVAKPAQPVVDLRARNVGDTLVETVREAFYVG